MCVAVLSPHRDDAAFSCGLLLAALLRAGHGVRIVNVCTVSAYAPYLAPASADRTAQVTAARRDEDARLVEHLQAYADNSALEIIDLNWQDLPLRWATADETSLAPSSLREDEVETLANVLRRLPSADLVLVPQALGGHLDHRLVRCAAQRAFMRASIVFYEDLPYACGTSTKPLIDTQSGGAMEEHWLPNTGFEPGLKRALCLCYSSQIDAAMADRMEAYGLSHGGERFVADSEAMALLRSALLVGADDEQS